MRFNIKSPLKRLQRGIAGICVMAAVLSVPAVGVYQLARPVAAKVGPDTSHPLHSVARFKPRLVDRTAAVPRLFAQPLITVSFDDGWQTNYTVALPLLQKYGIHSTQYVLSGTEDYPDYLSWAQIEQIHQAGHEIACHSVSHPDLTKLSADQLKHQLVGCQQAVSAHVGAPVTDFASPYGAENQTTLTAIMKHYQSQRNIWGEVDDGIDQYDVNLKGHFARRDIVGYTVEKTTSLNDIKRLVDFTSRRNGWLVLAYHQVDADGQEYAVTKSQLNRQLQYLSSTNIRIVTVQQVIQALSGKAS